MNTIEDDKLKPCPFCASDNVVIERGNNPVGCAAYCENCNAQGPFITQVARKGAIDAWDRRESNNGEWIRCEDDLPQPDQEVWVCPTGKSVVFLATFTHYKAEPGFDAIAKWSEYRQHDVRLGDMWQPSNRPKPPKKETTNEKSL